MFSPAGNIRFIAIDIPTFGRSLQPTSPHPEDGGSRYFKNTCHSIRCHIAEDNHQDVTSLLPSTSLNMTS